MPIAGGTRRSRDLRPCTSPSAGASAVVHPCGVDEVSEVSVSGGSIRLGQVLKLAGLVENGSDVRPLIADGLVRVDGEVETRRGAQLVDGALVSVEGVGSVRVRAS